METGLGLVAKRLVKSNSTCGTNLQTELHLLLSAFAVRGRQNNNTSAANKVVLIFISLLFFYAAKLRIFMKITITFFLKIDILVIFIDKPVG
jgi:hypothetical protein